MSATLFSLVVSHPARAARGMLDLKGIETRVVDLPPSLHPVVLRARGFRHNTVPALVVEGRRIQGSRNISRGLDDLQPSPPLFPNDPEARRAVEDAELWGEQVFQAVPRRINRWSLAHSHEARTWLAEIAKFPLPSLAARPAQSAKAFARAVGADDAAVQADIAALNDHFDHVAALRSDGVIGGDQPNAADFQIACSLLSLAKLGDLAPFIADHPEVRWAGTVLPALPGPTPKALPPEWLTPLRAHAPG